MDILSFVNKDIAALQLSDNFGKAAEMMTRTCLRKYPVVEGKRFAGYLPFSLPEAYAATDLLSLAAGDLEKTPVVSPQSHWYNILKLIRSAEFETLAVVDARDHYHGIIDARTFLQGIGDNLAIKSPGTVLVLRVRQSDFELSRIARIVEEKLAKILFMHVDGEENSGFLTVHIKVNTLETIAISRDLERFGYDIIDSFQEHSKFTDDLMDNYQALMKYLDY